MDNKGFLEIKMSRKTHKKHLSIRLPITHKVVKYTYGANVKISEVYAFYKPTILGVLYGVLILPIAILYEGLGEIKYTFKDWKRLFITGYVARDCYIKKEGFEEAIEYL